MKIYVFGGPSLVGLARADRAAVTIFPPAAQSDILRLTTSKRVPGVILLVDGVFGSALAVPPAECRLVMDRGWILCGCSSMGALRASELYPMGMIGLGEVYTWLRCGIISDDSDLASAFDPMGNRALSVPMVWVRSVVESLRFECGLGDNAAKKLLRAARAIHWSERTWNGVIPLWRRSGLSNAAVALAEQRATNSASNPKVADASAAVRTLIGAFSLLEDEAALIRNVLRVVPLQRQRPA